MRNYSLWILFLIITMDLGCRRRDRSSDRDQTTHGIELELLNIDNMPDDRWKKTNLLLTCQHASGSKTMLGSWASAIQSPYAVFQAPVEGGPLENCSLRMLFSDTSMDLENIRFLDAEKVGFVSVDSFTMSKKESSVGKGDVLYSQVFMKSVHELKTETTSDFGVPVEFADETFQKKTLTARLLCDPLEFNQESYATEIKGKQATFKFKFPYSEEFDFLCNRLQIFEKEASGSYSILYIAEKQDQEAFSIQATTKTTEALSAYTFDLLEIEGTIISILADKPCEEGFVFSADDRQCVPL